MSICIPAATGEGLSAQTFGHFGSAPYFVLHDPATGKTEVLENQNVGEAHGGCQPLAAVVDHDLEAIVVGGIGSRAIARLNAQGIRVLRAESGTVADNIANWHAGRLAEITPDNGCSGHRGSDHGCG